MSVSPGPSNNCGSPRWCWFAKIKLVWLGHSLLTGGTPLSPFLFFLAPLPRETAITVAYAGSVGVRKRHSEEEGFKGSEERSPSLLIVQRVLTGYN